MNVQASAGRTKFPLRDYCETLDMQADNLDESRFMAALFRAITFGGTLTATTRDGRTTTIRFLDSDKVPDEASS
jgi:hypothetical protein